MSSTLPLQQHLHLPNVERSKHAKALGYIFDFSDVYEQAVKILYCTTGAARLCSVDD
jgi:hypothetical protein